MCVRAPSFSNPTICKSLWTLPITCYSCSERVHGASFSLGYQCNAQSKTCECTGPVSVDPEDERDRPDDVDWRGDSWCDKIMRGYRHAAIRTPLENVWVHKCGRLREFGIGLTNWLGLQSVPYASSISDRKLCFRCFLSPFSPHPRVAAVPPRQPVDRSLYPSPVHRRSLCRPSCPPPRQVPAEL